MIKDEGHYKGGNKPSMFENTTIQITRPAKEQHFPKAESEKSKRIKAQEQSRKLIKEFEIEFNINQILHFIFDVADRNQVYKCNFIHLHIGLGIVLKMLDIRSKSQDGEQTYLRAVIKAISQKVQKHERMKLQLKNSQMIMPDWLNLVLMKSTEERCLKFLRWFLENNKELMQAVMPYYYNYFALVVNKEIAFLERKEKLLQYSIDYEHQIYKRGEFTRKDIMDLLQLFEKKLVDKYHSKDI